MTLAVAGVLLVSLEVSIIFLGIWNMRKSGDRQM
jgi:hypothetical protein